MLTKSGINHYVWQNILYRQIPNGHKHLQIYRILKRKCDFPTNLFLYLKHFNYKILC